MDKEALTQRLMATFVGELDDHVRALNRDLLRLEKDPDGSVRDEVFETLFRSAHSLKGAARSVNVGVIEMACHRLEEIFTAARDGRMAIGQSLFHLLFMTVDAIGRTGQQLRQAPGSVQSPLTDLLGPLEGAVSGDAEAGLLPLVDEAPPSTHAASGSTAVVRVPAERLDALLAHSNEFLVTLYRTEAQAQTVLSLQSLVKQWQADWRDRTRRGRRAGVVGESQKDRLRYFSEELARLAKALESDRRIFSLAANSLKREVHQARMLPFADVCQGVERAVRDLARESGKEVNFEVDGTDIEIDRSILEGLKDPLLHLARNAIDHGIESPAVRRADGKPTYGRISVQAMLRGSRVHVVVADDGRGLDAAAIREQARKQGMPEPADESLTRLIFAPGFSTAPSVTAVSGRGIGLDVVRAQVEALRGSIAVSFAAGRGTRFELSLPLTLTTIRGLVATAAGQSIVFDSASVQALLRVGKDDLRSVEGREVLLFDGRSIPVASLASVLGWRTDEPARDGGKVPVVVLSAGDDQAAFAVDELVVEQEILVKSLGPRFVRVRNVSAATILPTGRIALILNASDLVQAARRPSVPGMLSASLAVTPRPLRKRLLVVDDSVTTRTLETSILEASGYEVLAAVDGFEAWRLLQEQGADLVVTDIEMPRMNGFELTETIRGSKRFRDLPVILVTALETEADRARGLQVGADAYLIKSGFDQQVLLDSIAQLL